MTDSPPASIRVGIQRPCCRSSRMPSGAGGRTGKVVAAHRHYIGRHARRYRAYLAAEIERLCCEKRRGDERLQEPGLLS